MPVENRALERIEAQGFKSIREADIALNNLNILIGANGAGKSNFISLFRLLNEMLEGRLQSYTGAVGASNLFYFGPKVTSEITVKLYFGATGYEATFISSSRDTLIFASEVCWYHEKDKFHQPYIVNLGEGHKETLLFEEASKRPYKSIADHVIESLSSWKVYHFHDTSSNAGIKQTGDINDNARLRPDASNLAAFLYLLRETERPYYERIVKTVQLAAPFFDDFVLRPSPLNPEKIRLEWREKGSDAYFNANTLSDGTLRFICLATLLLQPELPSVILIDEPELGLHPYAISLLAGLLKSAASETQVIVSTQSVPLVNQFEPQDIIVVDREDGQSIFRRLDTESLEVWLDEYGLGDLWEKNLLGGRPQPWEPQR